MSRPIAPRRVRPAFRSCRRSKAPRYQPSVEGLEQRRLLATVNWVSSSSGNWNTPSNWSMDAVPGPADDVTINKSGITVTIDSGSQSVKSLATDDPLSITVGSLTVNADSTISGGLTMTGGSLTASGSGVTLTVTGTTNVSAASFYAHSGAAIDLPQFTTYSNTNGFDTTHFQAAGAGSTLSLSALTSLGTINSTLNIQASQGGQIQLPALAAITSASQYVQVSADGAGSVVDLSALTSFHTNQGGLAATNGGKVLEAKLTSLDNVSVTLDPTGTLATGQWATLTSGGLTATAGTFPLNLTTIDNTGVHVSGGAVVSLPDVTSANSASFYVGSSTTLSLPALATYSNPLGFATRYFQVTGTGAVLNLPALTSLGTINSTLNIQASQGGQIQLPALAAITSASQYVQVSADGAGSVVDLSALTSFHTNQGGLAATNGGKVLEAKLTSLDNVSVTLDPTGTLATGQWATLTSGGLTATAGTFPLNLTTIDNTGVHVSGGAVVSLSDVTSANSASFYVGSSTTLSLPALATYSNPLGFATRYFQVTGTGAVLNLPALTSLGTINSTLNIQASQGGQIQLPALAAITSASQYVQVSADGAGSVVDLSALTSFAGGGSSSVQITNGGTVLDRNLSQVNGVSLIGDSTGTFTISSSLGFTISGGTSTVQTGTLLDEGTLSVQSGATLNIEGGLSVDGSGILSSAAGSTIEVSGDLLGTTENADDFNPLGTVELDSGTGTSNPPQELEAMSDDLGAVQAGFANNFAYGTISLASDTSMELVDLSHNSSSPSPEAVYANELIVPSGATLNLNNLHLYVRGDQISGAIVGGTVTLVPSGGSIALNTPTPGTLSPAGAADDWTFYATAGESITVQLNAGGGGPSPALSPLLNWGQVELLDPNDDVLASASSASSGAIATISGFSLAASETYTIQVQAPAGHTATTGNYVLSAYNVTPNIYPLTINQSSTGTIRSGYGVDQWTFTGAANEQVELNVISTADGNVAFDLTGPSGTVFSNLQTNSGPVTLPSSGSYVLTAHGTGGQRGAYAFELEQTSVTDLTLGTPYSGNLAGSGQAQLFKVSLPATQALVVKLQDSSSDANQLYASLGSPPTLGNYEYDSSNGVTASPQLLVPSAEPGHWYILVYSASVPSTSTFSLTATGVPITLTTVAPAQSAAGSTATLTLKGSGFSNATSVHLVSMGNTVYDASSVSLDTFTQLTATFDLSSVPQGTYSVVVTMPGGQSTSLGGAFIVTPPGAAHFVSHLVLPSKMGRHISSTIYVEYANTGTVAMPAPLLVLTAPPEVIDGQTITNLPLFTLNPALVVSGYWTSAIPEGYSNSVEILATGSEVPGWLGPGESETVPVYYAGMQQPWSFAETSFQFALDYYNLHDTTALDWSNLQASLQPPGISSMAWNAISISLATEVGDTWGGYVTMLDNEASYLGRLGEDVTDVGELWSFAMMQADGMTPTPELAGATDIDVAVPGQASLDFSRVYQEPLSARDAVGPLGYGWTDDWRYSLSLASDGTVTVTMPGGEQRVFQPDSRGSDYFDQPGDYGILTEGSGGTFSLKETDGEIEEFNANGKLDYIEDTNGNRITAGYNSSGLLESLTDTSGASLSIAYNAQGLIASVTSSDGRTVTYTYRSFAATKGLALGELRLAA